MRIALAYAIGVVASALGLYASYTWDFPSGPAIVCALGLFLVLYAVWQIVRPARRTAGT